MKVRILGWILIGGMITSLFYVGKCLHEKPEPDDVNLVDTRKKLYFMLEDTNAALRQTEIYMRGNQLDSLTSAIKRLSEKMSVETDFGYGDSDVISCEKCVAEHIHTLLKKVQRIREEFIKYGYHAPTYEEVWANLSRPCV